MSVQNAMTIAPNPDCVLVNELNVTPNILFQYRHYLKNASCWHKFIISNTEGLSRNEVLGAILHHVHPLDLIPVFFAKDAQNSHSYFLARNCEAAIEKLFNDNLVVDHPYSKGSATRNFKPFKLSIILNFANTNNIKIDVQKNVSTVLAKRFNMFSKVLNLDTFYLDPGLVEFCPLSQPKIMYFVLHIAKNLAPQELILSNNGINILNPLEILTGLKMTSLDLSNNEIKSINDLNCLKNLNLKDLKLTGNILCDCDEFEYVSRITGILPTVEILDGVVVSIERFKCSKRNFFCDYECVDLVNQFLEYFFTAYDTDRKLLLGLYHKDAMFSLTCVYLSGQLSSSTASLKQYSNISRNLKKAADLSKTSQFLYRGNSNIINVFTTKIPFTEHDPYSFTADLMYKTDTCAVIMVTGVFHEKPTFLLEKEQFLGFSRSFALQISGVKCVITNDELHIYNGLTHQERNAFIEAPVVNSLINRELIPKPQTEKDCSDLIKTLGHLAGLNDEWSKRCLDEANYDLKAALELFVDLYKGDRIPTSAFT